MSILPRTSSSGLFELEAVGYPDDHAESATNDLMRVLSEVAEHRYHQDNEWGLSHPSVLAFRFEPEQFEAIMHRALKRAVTENSDDAYRARLMEIAATAVAAVQAWDARPRKAIEHVRQDKAKAAHCTDGLRPAVKYGPRIDCDGNMVEG